MKLCQAMIALSLVAGAPLAAGCSGGQTSSSAHEEAFRRMTMEELEAKMADAKAGKVALHLFDNNEKDRFEKSHIPGAKWVQFDKVQASDLPADKEAILVFYCANDH